MSAGQTPGYENNAKSRAADAERKRQQAALEENKRVQAANGDYYQGGYEVDPETGLVIDPGTGRASDETAFDAQNVYSQDPDRAQFVANPHSPDSLATQEAYQASRGNIRLARESLGERQGMDVADYTINPTFYDQMSWDPSERYDNEQQIDQTRTDETGLQAQRDALGGYRDIASHGGLTDIDRAAVLQSQMMREQELRGNREAIARNAAEQGRGSSLMSFMQQGQAAQGTANQRALDDYRMQAAALGRKDNALDAMASVGGNIQSSQDAIDTLNTNASRDVQQRNVARQNQGVDARYQDEQSTGRANVDIANEAEVLNKGEAFGVRGKQAAIEAQRAQVMNANTNHGNLMTGKQASLDAKSQADTANWISGASILAGAGTGIVKKGFGL